MARVEPRVDAGIGAEAAPVDGDTPVGHDGPGVDPVRDGVRTWNVVRDAVARAVVGADAPLRLLLVALLADGHALIEDVPGVGKTLLARAFARSLGLTFARIQGTPDLLPADITGTSILDGGAFRFIAGPVFHNVVLVARSLSRASRDRCPSRSSRWRPRIRSSMKARSRCPRRSSIASSSAFEWDIRTRRPKHGSPDATSIAANHSMTCPRSSRRRTSGHSRTQCAPSTSGRR